MLRLYPIYPRQNPLFDIEARHLPWGDTLPALRQRSGWWIGWVMLAGVGIWSAVVVVAALRDEHRQGLYTLWDGILLLFGLSLMDKLLLDFGAVSSALESISREIRTGRWDLIAISDFPTRYIVDAKHNLAQIRSWRMTMRVIAVRLTVIALMILTLFLLPLIYPPDEAMLNPYTLEFYTTDEVVMFVFMVLAFIEIGVIYLIEPLWRVRALCAASLAISSYQYPPGFAMLAAFGAIVGVWIVQIMIAIAAVFMLWFTSFFSFMSLTTGIGIIAYILAVGLIIRNAYNGLTNYWLRRAHRRLATYGRKL